MSPIRLPTLGLLDPGHERGLARLEEALRLVEDLADGVRPGGIGDEAAERDADVDRDDVAVGERVAAGDPVHDHVVAGDAQRRRVAAVALEGRDAALGADVLLRDPVELARRHAGAHVLAHQLVRPGDDLAGRGHLLELACALPDDRHRCPLP